MSNEKCYHGTFDCILDRFSSHPVCESTSGVKFARYNWRCHHRTQGCRFVSVAHDQCQLPGSGKILVRGSVRALKETRWKEEKEAGTIPRCFHGTAGCFGFANKAHGGCFDISGKVIPRYNSADEIANRDVLAEEPKVSHEGGATRTVAKTRFDLVPAEAEHRVALRYGQGAEKHGENNWKKGGKDFIKSCLAHAQAHLNAFKQSGNKLDDNLGAALWNISSLCWFESHKPEEFAAALRELQEGNNE